MPGTVVRPIRRPSSPPPGHRTAGALVGRVIGDRYRLLLPIAEGLASSVFKAEHVRMGKVLCVKILRGPLARDPELAARFRTEARVVSRLSHPHTIAVFDFGELEGSEGFYLAMEYLHGENLFDVLRREGRLPESRAAAIGEQLLGALGEAHEAGIVHRDVKPANVMLLQHKNDADFVKLLDFGIAEIEGQGPGGGLGTPTYLSPEQARGAAPDARSDLYSLGVLLYEMVGGRPPFVAPNPMAVLSAHLHEEPPPLASLNPAVSPAFAAVVHRALAKRPEERFENADAMRVALHAAVIRGGPEAEETTEAAETTAEITGELEIARRGDFLVGAGPTRKDPRRALLPGALALAFALAVLFAASRVHRQQPTDVEELEPNDAPSVSSGAVRGTGWLELARQNVLGDADVVRARCRGRRRGHVRGRAAPPRPGARRRADPPASRTRPRRVGLGGQGGRPGPRPRSPTSLPWRTAIRGSRSWRAFPGVPSTSMPVPPPREGGERGGGLPGGGARAGSRLGERRPGAAPGAGGGGAGRRRAPRRRRLRPPGARVTGARRGAALRRPAGRARSRKKKGAGPAGPTPEEFVGTDPGP